jgi:phytoene dehydrogenase-like protein
MQRAAATDYDAVIVGSGPNGLAAAVRLAQRGLRTHVVEAADIAGGGMRSLPLTLDGFVHDLCSAVHPLGVASPFFARLGLERHGLEWIDSPSPLAHVLEDGSAVMLERSVRATAEGLGPDGPAYCQLFDPLVERAGDLLSMVLGPLRFPAHPWLLARFGWSAIRSMRGLARARFETDAARALLAGIAAHAMVPLDRLATASFALVLAAAGHSVGWPIARGGSQSIADALVAMFQSLGGSITVGHRVRRMGELPSARAYLFDTSPRELVSIAGDLLPPRYVERLRRFRYGPGVCKVDWALSEPIPWRDPLCRRAVTVHVGGTLERIARTEELVHDGMLPDEPFVLLGQPSIVDPTRSPAGKHTAWAY